MRRLLALVALAGCCRLGAAAGAPVEVHPAGASVPENLLHIELRFAQAQRLPFDVGRLRLLDADGSPIENALLDLALPDAQGKRITVLMDPGRVKTDAGPNRAAGRALRAGTTVRLLVADAPPGAPPFVKQWRVTAAQAEPLQPALWQLSAPRARSREPLVVDLRKPISSSGEHLIAVRDAAGRRVRGRSELGQDDRVWRFTPARPWHAGGYALVTHADLEDVAGNRRCGAFEQVRASDVRCDADFEIAFDPAVASH